DKECERASSLYGDDAAQLEVFQKPLLRPGRAEVGDEAMANVLIRIGAFAYVVELILREIDEGREVPVVNDVRPRVVGVQRESLAQPFGHLQRHAVVIGVDDAVVVVEKTAVGKLQPVRENRFARQQKRSPAARAQ